jgi:hypothetical protein
MGKCSWTRVSSLCVLAGPTKMSRRPRPWTKGSCKGFPSHPSEPSNEEPSASRVSKRWLSMQIGMPPQKVGRLSFMVWVVWCSFSEVLAAEVRSHWLCGEAMGRGEETGSPRPSVDSVSGQSARAKGVAEVVLYIHIRTKQAAMVTGRRGQEEESDSGLEDLAHAAWKKNRSMSV